MTDLSQMPLEAVKCWPSFDKDSDVALMRVLDLIEWVRASNRALHEPAGPENMPIIAMPDMQRTAVWKPKQVLDVWDSLMRGLPLGTLYLLEQRGGTPVPIRNTEPGDSQVKLLKPDRIVFELLDGQQRVHALLAGVYGPAEGKLCLWVDFGAEGAGQSPCLRVTSKSQPFGYDAKTGDKLDTKQRRDARADIEPDQEAHQLRFGDRQAYDLDLFDEEVTQNGTRIEQPPRPYSPAGTKKLVKLHHLFAAWKERSPGSAEEGVTALHSALPKDWTDNAETDIALRALHKAFTRVRKAQVVLLFVKIEKSCNSKQTLLTLFERIGANGTPLSPEERLFSIYKHYAPEIRYAVNAIYGEAGCVLSPTKIAGVALRIANASLTPPKYIVPSFTDFATLMAAVPKSGLHLELNQIISARSETNSGKEKLLSNAFVKIKQLLSPTYGNNAFWIPDVMIANLPAELWQILIFWAVRLLKQVGQKADFEASREEIVRFTLFWQVFVWNDRKEKAAQWAFVHIAAMGEITHFPGFALYRHLIKSENDDRCACALIEPDTFKKLLLQEKETPGWRADKDRFGEAPKKNETGAHWWWHGRKALPWLQRDYIRDTFPGYAPLTDHDDDLPYDVDHICPKKDWRRHYSASLFDNVEQEIQDKMHEGRDVVGDGIGNLRLLEASLNRRFGDDDVLEKMPFIEPGNPTVFDENAMANWAFPPETEHRALWKRVSRPGESSSRKWDNNRLAAFQQAVEQRATWLYQQFHDKLEFGPWTSAQPQGNAVEAGPVQDLDPAVDPLGAG